MLAEIANRYMEQSLFTKEIAIEPLPNCFKMPTIPTYEAMSDPFSHLDIFNVQMDLITTNNRVKCRCFPVTLGEVLRKWLR